MGPGLGPRRFRGSALRKTSKIGATRCQSLTLKYINFAFHWGSAPDSSGGAYIAPQIPLRYLGLRVEGGIWPNEKFWRGAPYGLEPRKDLIEPCLSAIRINPQSEIP